MRRSSWRSTRWTSRTPIRAGCVRSCSATRSWSRRWAARRRTWRSRRPRRLGLDKLTEAIMLQAEILDLKANPQRAAEGTVIESRLDRGRGPVATVLVQRGHAAAGRHRRGRRRMGPGPRDAGRQGAAAVRSPGPSTPVEILGLAGVPVGRRAVRRGGERRPRPRDHRVPHRASCATRRPARPPVRAARWTRCWPASRRASRRKSPS